MLLDATAPRGTVGVLDVGTHKIACLIAAGEPDTATGTPAFRLGGLGYQRSRGVKAGVIVDLDQAEQAVRAAVGQAERMAGVRLDEVVVGIACGRLRSRHFAAHTEIGGATVRAGDLRRVLAAGRAYPERDGRHVLCLDHLAWRLDGGPSVLDPRGMACTRLSADLHAVTVDDAPLRNLLLLVERCHLSVAATIPAPLAAALAVTSEEERRLGITCLDIGAGTTGICLFADGQFLLADAVPVGGNHLTFDIARELRTSLAEAERIKALYGTLVAARSDEHEAITYPLIGEEEPALHHTTKARLRSILQPRVEGLLALVIERVQRSGIAKCAGERVVLTGGTSGLVGMGEFTANALGRPVRVARPQPPAGAPASVSSPAFSAAIGLLLGARRSEPSWAAPAGYEVSGSGYVGRMAQWLRESF